MPESSTQQKPLPTIWRTPDQLWEKIEPILQEHDPPKNTGRPRVDQRAALDAIIFRMRSGCQWNSPECVEGEFSKVGPRPGEFIANSSASATMLCAGT